MHRRFTSASILVGLPVTCIAAACSFLTEPEAGPAVAAFLPAPPLEVTAWVQGEPVDPANHSGVVLIERWATWCGPCLAHIPALAALDTQHGDALTVIGITMESEEEVRREIRHRRGAMSYRVARDSEAHRRRWMAVTGESGAVPYIYLVRHGSIVWHGHPDHLEDVLPSILSGAWTEQDAASHYELRRVPAAYLDALSDEDFASARAIAEPLLMESQAATLHNRLAWDIVQMTDTGQRDLALAMTLAQRASGATDYQKWHYEDTLAAVHFASGDALGAIDIQQRAVSLCAEQSEPFYCFAPQQRLQEYLSAESAPE